jgi:hypothetical protein
MSQAGTLGLTEHDEADDAQQMRRASAWLSKLEGARGHTRVAAKKSRLSRRCTGRGGHTGMVGGEQAADD